MSAFFPFLSSTIVIFFLLNGSLPIGESIPPFFGVSFPLTNVLYFFCIFLSLNISENILW